MMAIAFSSCDPTRVDRLFAKTMSAEEQLDFERHLENCETCRELLQERAAEPAFWGRASQFLRDEPYDLAGVSHVCESRDGDADISVDSPDAANLVLELLAPSDDPRMLGRLGTYEVTGVIGTGGMGVVLKAFDPSLNRYVAIKVLAPHLSSNGTSRKRFSREAQAAAAVVHPNVIEIYGVAQANGLPYLVMPFVRGVSLQRRFDDNGPLALVEILRIGMQAAAGLAAAHAQGLVHRDIKPANILLADGIERVLILDFGLARAVDDVSMTRIGCLAGTPEYMSPEQAKGELVDQRSDLFSLGCAMFAMCVGRSPFRADTTVAVLKRICGTEPPDIRAENPEIPLWLTTFIGNLLEKNPDDRFNSADSVSRLLEQALAHVQQPLTMPLPPELESFAEAEKSTACRTPRKSRMWLATAFSSLAILAVAIGLGAFVAKREMPSVGEHSVVVAEHALSFARKDGLHLTGTRGLMTPGRPATLEFWARLEHGTAYHHLAGDRIVVPAEALNDGTNGDVKQEQSRHLGWKVGVTINEDEGWASVSWGTSVGGPRGQRFACKPGAWRHYAICANQDTVTIFVDGEKVSTVIVARSKWRPSPQDIWLGRLDFERPPGFNGFNGAVRAVRVSTTCRYEDNFAPSREFEEDDATAVLLDLSPGQGDTVKDLSGHDRHGTICGATWINVAPNNKLPD